MRMLIDPGEFEYPAQVPWSHIPGAVLDWQYKVQMLEHWLGQNVGGHYVAWLWCDSGHHDLVGVSFRWDQHRTLFVLTWA